jgi:hypothetical protein
MRQADLTPAAVVKAALHISDFTAGITLRTDEPLGRIFDERISRWQNPWLQDSMSCRAELFRIGGSFSQPRPPVCTA